MKKRYILFIFVIIFLVLIITLVIFNNKENIKNNEVIKKEKDNNIGNIGSSKDDSNNSAPSKIELIKTNGQANEITDGDKKGKLIHAKGEAKNILDISDDYIEYPSNDVKEEIFTVYFDYNGGTKDIESKKVIYENEYGNLPIPTKRGYTFDGWYTNKEGGEKIDSLSKNKIKSDHTLYANYTINNYLITYDYNYLEDNLFKKMSDKSSWNLDDFDILTNDDLFSNENVYKFKFKDGDSILKYNEELKLDKDKTYTFSVYIKSNKENNLSIGFLDDLMVVNINSSWQRYTKTFKANDNKYTDFIFSLGDNLTWNKDDTIEIYGLMLSEGNPNVKEDVKRFNDELGILDNPIRDGYTFDGWYTDFTFKEKIESSTLVGDIDKTYYARWVANLYTLKLDPNEGIYDEDSSVKVFTQGYDTLKKLDKPKATYKITYDLNNTNAINSRSEDIIDRPFIGFLDENNKLYSDDIYVFNKDSILLASYENNISFSLDRILKDNYTCFWNTKADGSGERYDSGSDIKINSDITLYAICDRNIKFARPLSIGYVTSEYGNRIHPIYGTKRFHSGIDMSSSDRNIYSVADGVVAKSGYNSSMGNYIIIYHNINKQNYTSAYYHLESIYVNEGQAIMQDTIIGKMGQTGLATGVHLHLTMYKGHLYSESSIMVNPRDYINFPSKLYKGWYDKITYLN